MRTQSAQLLSADDGGPMEIVTDIQLDPRNYRRHSKENKELIKKSLTECGAGRSILMDNKGQLIAGNGVFEQAKKLNIPTKIVQTDGSELVVVQRTDLAPEDIKRKKLAIMDNSASDSSEFDVALLVEDFSVEQVKELGVKNPKLDVEKEREIDICLHDGKEHIYERYTEKKSPQDLIKKFKLNTPIYAKLCREGLFSEVDDAK